MPASTARREGRRGVGPTAGAARRQGDAEQSRWRGARGGEEIHWRQVAARGGEVATSRAASEAARRGGRQGGDPLVGGPRGEEGGEEKSRRRGHAEGGRRVATDLGRRPRGRGTRGREEGRQKLGKLLRWSFSACSVKKSFWSFRGLENLTPFGGACGFWSFLEKQKLQEAPPNRAIKKNQNLTFFGPCQLL